MNPINFPEANLRLLGPLGENDPNILPLPVYNDGKQSISCWQLSDEEIEEVRKTGVIWFLVAGGKSAPPILPLATRPFRASEYYECIVGYESENKAVRMLVYNTLDADVPVKLEVAKVIYHLIEGARTQTMPDKPLGFGDFYIGIHETKPHLIQKLRAGAEIYYPINDAWYRKSPISEEQKQQEIAEILAKANELDEKSRQKQQEVKELLENCAKKPIKNHEKNH